MKPSPEELERVATKAIDLYRNLDTEIFREIANLLKTSGVESIEQWHIEALGKANMLNENVTSMLADVTGQAHSAITEMITNAGNSAINQVDAELVALFGNANKSKNTQNLIQAFIDQVFLDIDNFVSQTLITTHYGLGITTQMFQEIINTTTANFMTGNLTLPQSVESTILSWSKQGVSTIFIDRGGHTWSLERYVDLVLRSILNRTYNELRMSRMRDFGVFTAVVTTLMDSAPRCVDIQGQVVDTRPIGQANSGFPSIYSFGYPAADGPFGINCRHQLIPFIPGVNENNQPTWNKQKTVERSAIRDRQRELERRIRRTKKEIILLEELGSPNLQHKQNLLSKQEQQIQELVDGTNFLSRNRPRERVFTPSADIIRDELGS